MGRATYFACFAASSFVAPVFAAPFAYYCDYEVGVAANISEGLGVQTDISTDDEFSLQFVVEANEQDGTMIGNAGASNVVAIWGKQKVTFIEVTANGTVQSTVVYGEGFGTFASAHSRTTGGPGYEMPSQYYGFCDVR